jgi:hypothetical protein
MASAIQEHIRRTSVLEACSRHGIPHGSELAKQLESEAEITSGRNPYVRTTSGVSLDERIGELAKIPKFASSLPVAKPVVAATDTQSLADHFADIASGKVIVK